MNFLRHPLTGRTMQYSISIRAINALKIFFTLFNNLTLNTPSWRNITINHRLSKILEQTMIGLCAFCVFNKKGFD